MADPVLVALGNVNIAMSQAAVEVERMRRLMWEVYVHIEKESGTLPAELATKVLRWGRSVPAQGTGL